MNVEEFVTHPRVQAAVAQARQRVQDHPVSDVVDGEGLQYVDLVMEGGGILGIALVGYTYVLEQAGLRFLGIAGTSAGAINATLMAGFGAPHEAKSERVAKALADIPLEAFLDGDGDAKKFSHALAKEKGRLSLLYTGLQVVDNLRNDLGLHPGKAFRDWMAAQLASVNVKTVADLKRRLLPPRQGLHQLRSRLEAQRDVSELAGELVIVAADVTTRTKVVLPKMSALYWPDPENLNPAEFARASMSVPFFFWPLKGGPCPKGDAAQALWEKFASYTGPIPDHVQLVDGGIIYNFPIGVFHKHDQVPAAPTFGVKLQLEDLRSPTSPLNLAGAIFDTARQGLQQDFIVDNPDYRHLVANIDTGDHYWLDFHLSDEDKVDLFVRGAERAQVFLQNFNWAAYKTLREANAVLRQKSGEPTPALKPLR